MSEMTFSLQQSLTVNICLGLLLLSSEQNSFVSRKNMSSVDLNGYVLHSQQVYLGHNRVAPAAITVFDNTTPPPSLFL